VAYFAGATHRITNTTKHHMNKHLTLGLGLLLVSLTPAILAQTTPGSPVAYGPQAGANEFTLGGNGSSNKDFNHGQGGFDLSLGNYLNNDTEVLIRQTVDYGSKTSLSTLLALDQHFLTGPFRPFAGVNLGYVYGSAVRDTFAAGLEAGAKYYVMPKTFVFAMLDYSFLFRSDNQIHNRFDHGEFMLNAGVGFNF
jgi:hypothetical protein